MEESIFQKKNVWKKNCKILLINTKKVAYNVHNSDVS